MKHILALLTLLATPAMAQVQNPTGLGIAEVMALMPQPANTQPPGVTDTGSLGASARYALSDHTHASRARKLRVDTDTNGNYIWTFTNPFTNGVVPVCTVTAETAAGVTDVINAQIVGAPTSTGVTMLVNRTNKSTVALIGLTVLSVPASPGVTKIHAICLEP